MDNTSAIDVVAAVISNGEQILCFQRVRSHEEHNSEKWEFPGGKVEPGESHYEALLREIREELQWDIFVGKKITTITHEYPDLTINLHAYLCRPGFNNPTLLEHLDMRWLRPEELQMLSWSAADAQIVSEMLSNDLLWYGYGPTK